MTKVVVCCTISTSYGSLKNEGGDKMYFTLKQKALFLQCCEEKTNAQIATTCLCILEAGLKLLEVNVRNINVYMYKEDFWLLRVEDSSMYIGMGKTREIAEATLRSVHEELPHFNNLLSHVHGLKVTLSDINHRNDELGFTLSFEPKDTHI